MDREHGCIFKFQNLEFNLMRALENEREDIVGKFKDNYKEKEMIIFI